MPRLRIACPVCVCWLVVLGASASSPAQTSRPAAAEPLPAPIAHLRDAIRGMRPIQVRAAIKARFGDPTRDAGSGLWIPQWDVAGGTLTCHPLRGPTFTTRAGIAHWLLETNNPARDTILTQYEMSTRPDPKHGNRFWIGDVYLDKDLNYRFVDGGQFLRERGDQSRNFFIAHPAGRVEIHWSAGIKDDTPLESAADGTIAHLVFRSATDASTLNCLVASSRAERSLDLQPERGEWSFRFDATWAQFWPVPAADDAEMGKLTSTPP